MNYKPVEREDIDLNETYCIWISDDDYDFIYPDDLKHFFETGELIYDGYEITGKRKEQIFKRPVFVTSELDSPCANPGCKCNAYKGSDPYCSETCDLKVQLADAHKMLRRTLPYLSVPVAQLNVDGTLETVLEILDAMLSGQDSDGED